MGASKIWMVRQENKGGEREKNINTKSEVYWLHEPPRNAGATETIWTSYHKQLFGRWTTSRMPPEWRNLNQHVDSCNAHPMHIFFIKNYIYLFTKVSFDQLGYHKKIMLKIQKKKNPLTSIEKIMFKDKWVILLYFKKSKYEKSL